MRLSLPTLLVLHSCPEFWRSTAKAVGPSICVERARDWADITRILRARPFTTIGLVDPYGPEWLENRPVEALRELLRSTPRVRVIAVISPESRRAPDLRLLDAWGVGDLVFAGPGGGEEIKRVVKSMVGAPGGGWRAVTAIHPLNKTKCALLDAAESVAQQGGQSVDLARLLHISVRTLVRRCESFALPTPGRLLGWLRVLHASELLRDGSLTVRSVAEACGYASAAGLHRASKKLLGASPRALRQLEGLSYAVDKFTRALDLPPIHAPQRC